MRPRIRIAPLLVVAAFVFVASASGARAAAVSSPAPARNAAPARHSVAGASATATHAARAHRHGWHHRGHRGDRTPRIIARRSGGTAGGSPPQPARRSPAPHHHATLSPSPHSFRHLARSKAGGHGLVAEVPAWVSTRTAMGRVESKPQSFAISQDDLVSSERGPPRASPISIPALLARPAPLGAPHSSVSSSSPPDRHPIGDTHRQRLEICLPQSRIRSVSFRHGFGS